MMANESARMNLTIETGEEASLDVYYKFVVPFLFGTVTLLGIIGNLLVILVISTQAKMQSAVNMLLLNLAVADLCFVIVCPPFTAFTYAFDSHNWLMGNFGCKTFHYLLNVTVYVTIYTLVMISVVRFASIVYTMKAEKFLTKRNIIILSTVIWAMMLLANTPIIFEYGMTTSGAIIYCELYKLASGLRIYTTFFIFAYLLPLLVIATLTVCTVHHISQNERVQTKKKREISTLLITVVIIFAIFWFPIQMHLLLAWSGHLPHSRVYEVISILWNVLAYANSCVNPIIYNFVSKEFREAFKHLFSCLYQKKRTRKRNKADAETHCTNL